MVNKNNEQSAILKQSFLTEDMRAMLGKLLETDEETRKNFYKYSRYKQEELLAKVKELIGRVEAGEFTEEQMADVEYWIALLLAAIKLDQPTMEKEPGQE